MRELSPLDYLYVHMVLYCRYWRLPRIQFIHSTLLNQPSSLACNVWVILLSFRGIFHVQLRRPCTVSGARGQCRCTCSAVDDTAAGTGRLKGAAAGGGRRPRLAVIAGSKSTLGPARAGVIRVRRPPPTPEHTIAG